MCKLCNCYKRPIIKIVKIQIVKYIRSGYEKSKLVYVVNLPQTI